MGDITGFEELMNYYETAAKPQATASEWLQLERERIALQRERLNLQQWRNSRQTSHDLVAAILSTAISVVTLVIAFIIAT